MVVTHSVIEVRRLNTTIIETARGTRGSVRGLICDLSAVVCTLFKRRAYAIVSNGDPVGSGPETRLMNHVFARNSKAEPMEVSHGAGAYLFDKSVKSYLNCGDAAVSCLGHGDAHVTQAIKDQLDRVAFAHTGFFTSDPAENLADKLIALAPGDLDRVYFVSGGSEAMDFFFQAEDGIRGRDG